jgi:fibronectin-binding autotransporter adhesin
MAQRLVSLPRSTVVALVGLLVALHAGYSTAAVTIYTGIYAGGTIAAGDAVLLNDGASVTGNVVANGMLQFNQTGSLAINTVVSGTGTLSLTNTGSLTLTAIAANGYAALPTQLTMASGRLNIGTNGTNSILVAGSMSVTGGSLASKNAAIFGNSSGGGWLPSPAIPAVASMTGGTWTTTGNLTIGQEGQFGSLSLSGSGVLQVGGVLSSGSYLYFPPWTGFPTVGTWVSSGSTSLQSGGVLQIGLGGTTGELQLATLQNEGTLIFNRSNAATFSGAINGAGSVIKQGAGTLTLTGSSTYTGGTVITDGTLQIGAGGTSGWINGTVLNNRAVVFNRSDVLTFSGTISGTGSLTKRGAGTLSLAGTNSYSGGTTVSMGTVAIPTGGAINHEFTTLVVGQFAGDAGSLSVNGGRVASLDGYLGSGTGSRGVAVFSSGAWMLSGTLVAGASGTGTLEVSGGVVASKSATLGHESKGFGMATVTSGSWTNSDGLTIGRLGNGVLIVSGGLVSSQMGLIASGGLSRGDVTITGGTWANTRELLVGQVGTGSLLVNGGVVTSSTGYIGYWSNSSGTATVTSGTWMNTGDLYVGWLGRGTLLIDGGSVANRSASIGSDSKVTGSVVVSAGTWSNTGNLTVGVSGTASLTMLGGLVTVGGTLSRGPKGFISIAEGGTLQIGTGGTTGVLVTNLLNNGRLVFNRADASSYSGVVSGSGSLVKFGAGSLDLTGTSVALNTVVLDCDTIVSGGLLQIRSGTGGLSVGNTGTGALSVMGGNLTSFDGVLAASDGSVGRATISSGTWTNNGNLVVGNSGTGTLTMTGGRVIVGGTLSRGRDGVINLNSGGTLQIGTGGAGGVLLDGTGGLNNDGVLIFNHSSAVVYSGNLTGTGLVIKQGTGSISLSGSSGYSGGTVISRGFIVVPGGGCITHGNADLVVGSAAGDSGTLSLIGGSVNNLSSYLGDAASSVGRATISSGTWTNNGNLVVGNSGTGTLTMTGGRVIVGGTLSRGRDGVINLNSGGTLRIGTGGAGGVLNLAALQNNGTLVFDRADDHTHVGDISGSGRVRKEGSGTLTLSGSNSYTGGTTITAGVLQIGNGGANGSLAGAVVNNGELIFNRSDAVTYSGVISGTGVVVKQGAGSLTLVGSNRFSGGLVLSEGVLSAGGTFSIGSGTLALNGGGLRASGVAGVIANTVSLNTSTVISGSDALSITGDVILNRYHALNITNSARTSIKGVIRESVSSIFIKEGNGELELSGANTYTGGTLIQSGTVRINNSTGSAFGVGAVTVASGATLTGAGSISGAVQMNGTWAPGNSPGLVTVNSNVVLAGSLDIELGGLQRATSSTSGSGCYDALDATGGLVLGGALNVVLTNSFVPAPGNSFEILRYGQLSGVFGAVNLPAFDNGLGWQRVTTGTSMTLVAARSAMSIDVAAGSKTLAAAGYSSLMYATSLNKSGDGALVLNDPNALTGPTTIQQGTVQLAHSSALAASTISPLAGGTLSMTPNLQTRVGGLNPNAGGLVDVGTGMITVASGLSVADLAAAMESGRGNGSWDGTSGITSSAAASAMASSTLRSVGWLDNDNGSVTFGYAATGDTNLDWVIDILDVANFVGSGKFNSGLTATWAEGDFNYDGFADILDMADFMSTGLFNAAPYNTPAGSIAAVPEPSTLGFVGIGAGIAGLVAVRRKRAG